ncbi:hypothetical protein WJU23_16985 [Prosthecobacter sp. SYSU 5D2]|uniref:hypothetical protein n=1 Tax=Prosthecobacter sp. SYSU 5D2 TaxID=3134134 RepID=UPI0031FE57B7
MKQSSIFTQAVTTGWVALAAHRGEQVSVLNGTGAVLQVRYASQTAAGREITLADGQSVGLNLCATSGEVQIKAAAGAAGVHVVVR